MVHRSGVWTQPPQPRLGSGCAYVVRASQFQHTVERVDSDRDLPRATLVGMRAQSVPNHLLPARHGRLGASAFRVPGRTLPRHAPVLGDVLEVAVALSRRALGRRKGVDSSQRLGRHRWAVERTHAWMARLRRLTVRCEERDDIHLAFALLGYTLVCLNQTERFC